MNRQTDWQEELSDRAGSGSGTKRKNIARCRVHAWYLLFLILDLDIQLFFSLSFQSVWRCTQAKLTFAIPLRSRNLPLRESRQGLEGTTFSSILSHWRRPLACQLISFSFLLLVYQLICLIFYSIIWKTGKLTRCLNPAVLFSLIRSWDNRSALTVLEF